MIDRKTDFQNRRMEIFRELVKHIWNGEEIKELVTKIQKKYGYDQEDLQFIIDHLKVAMGVNPDGSNDIEKAFQQAKNLFRVEKPVVSKVDGVCKYCEDDMSMNPCYQSCKYDASIYRRSQGPVIVNNKCLSCGNCVSSCSFGALADKIEFVPLIKLLQDKDINVYAAVAPSIMGQFGEDVTLGKLRTALRLLGFKDLVEVAMFADLLTIKEAFEFHHLVTTKDRFLLTSCCCPVWINLVEKNYPELFDFMSPSVSPMIASGRILKILYPDSKVVFIGPCIAKKAEAKDPDLRDAIDFVLTYTELKEIFKALDINPGKLPGAEKDQASFGGRIYARTGGVSFSVKTVVNRIAPNRLIKFRARKVSGVKECREVLDRLEEGREEANFIEGMGCPGGCVGGPRTILPVEEATDLVNKFAEDSLIMTPFDNLNLAKILKELEINRIEDIYFDNRIKELLERKIAVKV